MTSHLVSHLPLKTFHPFSNLPTELRLQVWGHTLQPSLVTVCWDPALRAFISPRKSPSILTVNRESRAMGLEYYTLSFGSHPELARVYFAFALDTLCIQWRTVGPIPIIVRLRMTHADMERLQKFAIHESDLLEFAETDMYLLIWLGPSNGGPDGGFKSITVLCDNERVESGERFGRGDLTAYLETFDSQEEGPERRPKLCASGIQCIVVRECARIITGASSSYGAASTY